MNEGMRLLSSVKVQDKLIALKYAYAFMKCPKLYIKECSMINPNPAQIDKKFLFPRDAFSGSYSDINLPDWDTFKTSPINKTSAAFNCVASIDKQDSKRVVCNFFGDTILFVCYGKYEDEAKKIIDEIVLASKELK